MRIAKTLLAPAALGLALLGSTPLASASESSNCVQQMVYAGNSQGYRLRSYDSDALSQGYYMDYDVTLYGNVTYLLFACGDSWAYDIDIYLYDENGNLIDRDRATDNHPVVTVTPAWTGPFRVRIKMYSARGRANYTMAIMYH